MCRYIRLITEDEDRQGLIEYELVLSFIAAACVLPAERNRDKC